MPPARSARPSILARIWLRKVPLPPRAVKDPEDGPPILDELASRVKPLFGFLPPLSFFTTSAVSDSVKMGRMVK